MPNPEAYTAQSKGAAQSPAIARPTNGRPGVKSSERLLSVLCTLMVLWPNGPSPSTSKISRERTFWSLHVAVAMKTSQGLLTDKCADPIDGITASAVLLSKGCHPTVRRDSATVMPREANKVLLRRSISHPLALRMGLILGQAPTT